MSQGVAAAFGTIAKGRGSNRLISIDALRGIAALAVMFAHTLRLELVNYTGGWWFLAKVFSWGFLGVYLFFVISGFCIHLRWATQRARGADEPSVDFFAFWKRRIRRLYPAYIVALALYLAIGFALGSLSYRPFLLTNVGLHVLMLHNFVPSTAYSIDVVFWTLAVEEQLYLLYFAFLWLRRRYEWRSILAFALVLRAAWFVIALLVHRLFGAEFVVMEAALALWFCWLLGALSVEAWKGVTRLPAACSSLLTAAALLAASCTLYAYRDSFAPQSLAYKEILFLVQPMWALAFFCVLNNVTLRERALERSPRSFLRLVAGVGLFSYSLYLTHDMWLFQVTTWLQAHSSWSPDARGVFILACLVPLALLGSRAYFAVFERPFMTSAAKPELSEETSQVAASAP